MIIVDDPLNCKEQPMLQRKVLGFIVLIIVLSLAAVPASAANSSTAAFSLDCAGFTGTGGSVLLDRDNTGSSRESFILSATDGIGNIIYEPVVDQFFVGTTISWTDTPKIAWTSTPQYNPLTLRVISRSGNGFNEQLVSLSTGSCEGLPSFGAVPEGVFIVEDGLLIATDGTILPLGSTSPPVPLNTTAPRPDNEDEVIDLIPGYFIVNTDNLSVRTGDGPEYTLVAIVDGGTKLIPLGRNLDFSWWYIQAGDVVGWAKAEFLIARGDLTDVTVVPSNGEIAQPKFFNFSNAALLSAPSEGALELCGIAGDLDYLAVGRTANTDWYEIQATCNNALVRGWLPADQGAIRNQAGLFIPVTG
jgi:hypothetical protein